MKYYVVCERCRRKTEHRVWLKGINHRTKEVYYFHMCETCYGNYGDDTDVMLMVTTEKDWGKIILLNTPKN